MTWYLSQFGSLDIPTLDGAHQLSTPILTPSAAPILLGGAYRRHGTERRPMTMTTLTASGEVLGLDWSEVEPTVQALRSAIGTYAQLWRTSVADDARSWTYAELLGVEMDATPDYVLFQPLTLRFALFHPIWRAETATELTFTDLYDTSGGDLLLMFVGGGTPGDPVSMTWINAGTYPLYDPVITVTSGTGTVTALTIENTTPGYEYEFSWAGSLTTGQELVIDTGAMSVSRTGEPNAYSEFTPPADQARWFALAPGNNTVIVTVADTATDDTTVIEVAYHATDA